MPLVLTRPSPFAPPSILLGLISYWKLDEASDVALDSVGANTLADINTVTSAAGKVGTARQFTVATTEFLSIADNASLSTGDIDFTVAAWCRLDTLINAAVAGRFNVAGNQREWGLFINHTDHAPNDRASFVVSSNGTATAVIDATTFGAVAAATWYLLVAWHDSINNQIGISVNDASNTTAYATGVFDSTAEFRIGAWQTGAGAVYPFNGRIDEVGFWKRVLTASERTALYNSGNGATYPFLGM